MINQKPQTKISKAQYKALLNRMMMSTPPEQQQSQAGMMQQMIPGAGPPPVSMGGAEAVDPMALQAQMPLQTPGMVEAPPTQQMTPQAPPIAQEQQTPQIPIPGNEQQIAEKAAMVWQEIADGLGGALWQRLSATAGMQSTNPGESFIQAAIALNQNPAAIPDERVKQFLTSVLPPEQSAVDPVADMQDPLYQTILSTMR